MLFIQHLSKSVGTSNIRPIWTSGRENIERGYIHHLLYFYSTYCHLQGHKVLQNFFFFYYIILQCAARLEYLSNSFVFPKLMKE